MSHSHLSIRHFLQTLEVERLDRPRGIHLPVWLEAFIQEAAECFEPEGESARAGYVCTCSDDGWVVQLFLGLKEVVGGPADGANMSTRFVYDLEAARDCFDAIDHVRWHGRPAIRCETDNNTDDASAVITGTVDGQPVTLEILLRPQDEMGPALLQHIDGRCELV